ncbi:hypothetical protein MOC16_gp223 [Klebsiella phage vB_KpM_FBKp24]|uniref:Uncharacterized protein n=1 Tax=Klebsiella phage vB_KpM_FBKp24 TaxID=2801834 RepID=A0A7U0GBB8_9CAUD|nr:hypothetical protein MOC16_gp223 [Klebsiella phage vB_KpM_FBKp24]QQV92040.1 hypothetical protein vBKpMFBKp24_190 [Klebsiella phage vB_KpM_FBKp24]
MARLQEKLYLPYNELSRFLERIPDGMTYDLLQTKIPSLRTLNKKELGLLLDYVITKDRIVVTPITRKGVVGSPHLRHKMHSAPINVVAQPPQHQLSGEVVHIAAPGKQTLVTRKRTLINRIVPVMDKPAMSTETPVNKDEIVFLGEEKKLVNFDELRKLHLKDGKLINAAVKIKALLLTNKEGFTRTELDNALVEYKYLKGQARSDVLNYLKKYEGVKEQFPEGENVRYPVGRFVHGDFCKPLPTSEQRFDHAAPTLTLDPIPSVVDVRKIDPRAVGTLVIELLTNLGKPLPLFRVWNYIGLDGALSSQDRYDILNPLLTEGKIRIYDDAHPNANAKEKVVSWVAIDEGKPSGEEIVRTCGEEPTTAIAQAVMEALEKKTTDVKPNSSQYPNRLAQLEVKPVNLATLPEMLSAVPDPITPIELKEQLPAPTSSVDVRKQILELERVAAELEQKERNEALIAAIKPLRDEIVLQFAATQKAIDAQIDAQAALGLAIEQLNKVLGY